jgi:hypothetical protein
MPSLALEKIANNLMAKSTKYKEESKFRLNEPYKLL